MHVPEHGGIAVGRHHNDRMFVENPGEDLILPLIRLRAVARNGCGFLQQFARRSGFRQMPVEGFPSVAVAAAGREDDDAAFPADRLSRGHPLDRLIDILIERIPAVACHDNFAFRHADLAQGAQKLAPRHMRMHGVPGECADDFLFRIQHHIDNESQLCLFRRIEHIAVNRVSVEISGPCEGTPDEFRAVVRQHGFAGGDAGQHAFPSAGESGEEVRLDESLRHQQIGFDRQPVEDQFPSGGKRSKTDQHGCVGGVMHHDSLLFDDLFPEFGNQFLFCRSAVEPGCDQNGDPDFRRPFPQTFQNARHQNPAGYRTSMIAGDNHSGTFSAGEFFESRRADRVVQSPFDLRPFVGRRFREGRFEDSDKSGIIHLRRKHTAPVRDFHFLHNCGTFAALKKISHTNTGTIGPRLQKNKFFSGKNKKKAFSVCSVHSHGEFLQRAESCFFILRNRRRKAWTSSAEGLRSA